MREEGLEQEVPEDPQDCRFRVLALKDRMSSMRMSGDEFFV